MKKLFKWLLAVTSVLVIGIVLLLYNPGLIRGPIEDYLSEASGYSIGIEGDLKIGLGKRLALEVSDIRIANPEQDSGQNLVTLDHLKLILITASLFEDKLVIEQLDLDRLQTNLVTSEDGADNWQTTHKPQTSNGDKKPGPVVVFKDILLNDSTVSYQNGRRGHTQRLHIDSFQQTQNSKGMLHINLDGSFNDRPVEFEGEIGSFANILTGQDISFSGSGRFGDLNITGGGLIDDLAAVKHPQFNLQMEGPEIDEITAMLGFDDLGSGGFSLRAVGGLVNGQYEAGIHGDIGDLSLNVSAKAPGMHDLEIFDLELAANGPSLGSVTHSVGITGWPDKPFSLEGKVTRVTTTLDISKLTLSVGGTRLTLDALLTNFPDLEASRIKLLIGGDDIAQFRELLGIRGIATGPFEVRGNLDVTPDKLELVHVSMETSLGKASLSGTLGKAPNYTGTKLNVHLDGHNARTFVSAFGIDALPEQPFNLNTNIELVDQGLQIEQGVLVTIDDDRLELGGLIVLEDDGVGSDLQFKVSGQDLVQLLHRLIGNFDLPDGPYALGGRVKLLGDSIELQDLSAEYEGIKLSANGRLKMDKRFEGTAFDFQVEGENLSSLGDFAVVGDSMDIFVPGQAYQASGNFAIEPGGFRLSRVSGQLGQTAFTVNGSLNPQSGWIGSDIHFSIQGPDLNELIARKDEADLPPGPFDTNGHLVLAKDKLKISDFNFETSKSSGNIDVELGWPVSASTDVSFDVMVQGDDIRRFLPKIRNFEPAQTNFNITAKGQKLDSRVSVQKFEARLGNLDVVIVGNLIEESEDESADLAFRATSNDLSTLGRLNGEQLPAMPLDLIADFKGNARQFKLQNISAEFGESNVTGSIDISLEKPRSTINLALQSDLIDLRPFLGTEEPATDSPDTDDSDRLIPATPLPIDALAAIDGVIDIKINEIRHKVDSLENFVLDAVVNNGELQVPQFTVEGPRGKLRGNLSIVPTSPEKADVKFGLHADQLVLNLSGKPDADLDIVPAFDLNLNISGSGGDLQELAASLNGSLQMGSEGGTLEGVDLSLLDTFILDEVFSLIMPKTEKDDDLELSCVALIWKAEDGKMKTNPAFAFTTKKISVIAKGSINLKTEAIKINFNATPNKALKISASELFNPYILVGGTLADPAVGLDPTNVIVHGGAAAATAGISILAKGLLDRIGNIAPLCEEMLKKIEETP